MAQYAEPKHHREFRHSLPRRETRGLPGARTEARALGMPTCDSFWLVEFCRLPLWAWRGIGSAFPPALRFQWFFGEGPEHQGCISSRPAPLVNLGHVDQRWSAPQFAPREVAPWLDRCCPCGPELLGPVPRC